MPVSFINLKRICSAMMTLIFAKTFSRLCNSKMKRDLFFPTPALQTINSSFKPNLAKFAKIDSSSSALGNPIEIQFFPKITFYCIVFARLTCKMAASAALMKSQLQSRDLVRQRNFNFETIKLAAVEQQQRQIRHAQLHRFCLGNLVL